MEQIIKFVSDLLAQAIGAVFTSLYHNWIPLSLAILIASGMKVYVNTEKLRKSLMRKPKVSILASVAFGAFTPLCACGTMAVMIGLLTTTLPWGPMMAFLTSSPLMSPDSFVMLTGIIGIKFAVALTVASLIIGLGSGYITHFIERKTNYLKNQTRFSGTTQAQGCDCASALPKPAQACCSTATLAPEPSCGCSGAAPQKIQSCCDSSSASTSRSVSVNAGKADGGLAQKLRLREFGDALLSVGLKQILLFFSIFVAVGYLINSFVPTSIIMALFSSHSIFSVPLAALIGLPLYVSGESAIPLIQALMAGGAGGGAMLAFMITGQATSAWVIAGISTFMKRRVIGLYLAFILAGGIILGYIYDLVLASGL